MADSAVSLVLDYLASLLVQEARLLKGIYDKVDSIRGELEFIQSFLKDADAKAEKEDMSNVSKTWVKQVREKSYHIEDIIDEYILHWAKHPQGQRRRFHFLMKIFQFTTKLKPRHVITSKIQHINNDLKLPVEINGLCKLRYLAVYIPKLNIEWNINSRQAVHIPCGIGNLKSLQKLFNIEANNIVIAELGGLAQLRKLQISKLKRENGIALCIALKKMTKLRSLDISSTSEEEVLELHLMSSPPPLLQSLCLRGRLERFPEWISKLKSIASIGLYWSKLMDDPLM
ncbi:disease resistance protein RPM1-like, partial [Fagus crenata]